MKNRIVKNKNKRWVMLLLSTEQYVPKAIGTIYLARTKGEWQDDIVLIIPECLIIDEQNQNILKSLSVTIKQFPENKKFLIFGNSIPNMKYIGMHYQGDLCI
jgi:hypothetical protein